MKLFPLLPALALSFTVTRASPFPSRTTFPHIRAGDDDGSNTTSTCSGMLDLNTTLITNPSDIAGMQAKVSELREFSAMLTNINAELNTKLQMVSNNYAVTMQSLESALKVQSSLASKIIDNLGGRSPTTTTATAPEASDEPTSSATPSADPFLQAYNDHMLSMGLDAQQEMLDSISATAKQMYSNLKDQMACNSFVTELAGKQWTLLDQAGQQALGR